MKKLLFSMLLFTGCAMADSSSIAFECDLTKGYGSIKHENINYDSFNITQIKDPIFNPDNGLWIVELRFKSDAGSYFYKNENKQLVEEKYKEWMEIFKCRH